MPLVGILALQGDVREHEETLETLAVPSRRVRTSNDLEGIDGLIIPGGESTAISHLLVTSGLRGAIRDRLDNGLPVFGTCAGLILMARTILDGRQDQWSFETLDVSVRRNGYGRQIASFEKTIVVNGVGDVHGVFIRAPKIEFVGAEVTTLASLDDGVSRHPVLVRQGPVWGCSFHPELTKDARVHQLFVESL